MHYGPASYFSLGRVFPRDGQRLPFVPADPRRRRGLYVPAAPPPGSNGITGLLDITPAIGAVLDVTPAIAGLLDLTG